MITIYGDRRSGNCQKVAYVTQLLGIPSRWVDVDIMAGESRRPDFLRRNPAGQVPVLELDDGRCLAQSNAIIAYLAEGSSLLPLGAPGGAWERAQMLEWLFWEQYSHEPYIAVCRFQKVFLGWPDEQLDPERVERGNRALDRMEAHLAECEWLVGASLSLADVSLVAYTRLAHEGGFDLSGRGALRRWIRRVESALGIEAAA